MTISEFLHYYFFIAIGLCMIGLLDKILRLTALERNEDSKSSMKLIDAPRPQSFLSIVKNLLLGPGRNFHYRASHIWTWGYVCYHLAIFIVVTGYIAAAAILLFKKASGVPIPDFYPQLSAVTDQRIANGLAFIFGNAEPSASQFLFGSFSPWFQGLALADLPLAVVGNACLLSTVLRRRIGAVHHDIDDAVRHLRLKGQFSGQHLMVRAIIFTIILMVFICRMEWIPTITYYHAVLALTLIALFPFTYLAHIPLAPLVVWSAFRRRRRNAIA
jgi:hypothetical protein